MMEENTTTETVGNTKKPILFEFAQKRVESGKSAISLLLFLVAGYFLLGRNIDILLIITLVLLLHEMGHLLAMKLFKYTDLNIFFIPLLGAVATGKRATEASSTQQAIILLAGPVPGILLGCILYFTAPELTQSFWGNGIIVASILINLVNLLPILPLDGGRLLKTLFFGQNELVSIIFSGLSAATIAYFGISRGDYILMGFGLLMLLMLPNKVQRYKLKKELRAEGFDLTVNYNDLSDEQYYYLRTKMIQQLTVFKKNDLLDYDPFSKQEKALALSMTEILDKPAPTPAPPVARLLLVLIWLGSFAALLLPIISRRLWS